MSLQLDSHVVRLHRRYVPHAIPASSDLEGVAARIGTDPVLAEIRVSAEGADRRLGYLLAAAGFVTTFSGHSFGTNVAEGFVQSVLSSVATLAAFLGFLFALRGITRRVDPPLVLEQTHAQRIIEGAPELAGKQAYAWLSSVCLVSAIVLVVVVNWLNAFS